MKKTKLLSVVALSSVTLTLAPLATTLTCCGNDYYKKNYSAATIDIAEKLVSMNRSPRCTTPNHHWWNLAAIREWIFHEAIKAGVDEKTFGIDSYGNIWFDVEPTKDCEDWEPLIMQAHMDMVVTGLTKDTMEITPIDTVIDWKNGTVHSRDFKTTVGADDGFGIAAMLNVIQDKDVKHGPLRVFCSADEDSGMIGAGAIYEEYKSKAWNPFLKMGTEANPGKDIKYLLNIDAEELGEIYEACAGSITYNFKNSYAKSNESAYDNKLYIDITGFAGGHSGGDLNKDRANADKCIFEILCELSKTKNIQIVKHYHPTDDGKDISFQRNAIVSHARVEINTDGTIDDINKIISDKVDSWKTIYKKDGVKGENWDDVKVTCNTSSISHDTFLPSTTSKILVEAIGPNTAPVKGQKINNIWYGYISDGQGGYTMCANISPLVINFNEKTEMFDVTLSSQTRTKTTEYFNDMEDCYSEIKIDNIALTKSSRYLPWDLNENNSIVAIATQAYTSEGITPKKTTSTGGVEPTWWIQCNPNLNCACIGADITDAHGTKETLYLKSVDPVLKVIKKIMLAMERSN